MSGAIAGRERRYDPFQHAIDLDVEVSEVLIPGDTLGLLYLDAHGSAQRIEIDRRSLQRENRATVAHELAHLDVHAQTGSWGNGPDEPRHQVEDQCDRIAAERLIDVHELVEAAKWADSIEELADELNVDSGMVLARIASLQGKDASRFERAAGQLFRAGGVGEPSGSTLKRRKGLGNRVQLPW